MNNEDITWLTSEKVTKVIGSELKKARRESGLTQKQMAKRCLLDLTTYGRYEREGHIVDEGQVELIKDALEKKPAFEPAKSELK